MVLVCVVVCFVCVGVDDGVELSESGGGGVVEVVFGIECDVWWGVVCGMVSLNVK